VKEQDVSTAEVLDSVARERRRMMAALRALGERATTVAVTDGGWTAKDVVAHLIHWAGQIAWGLGAEMETPPWVLGVTGRLEGDGAWNARVVGYYHDLPFERVMADFDRSVDALVERLTLRTNSEMNATDAIPWAGSRPLWQIVGAETYEHWPAHCADLERAARVTS
jgi:hypothetical protein